METGLILRHLQQAELCAALPPATQLLLARQAQRREVAAGGVVFLADDTAEGAWLLLHGSAKLVRTAATGREQTLRLLRPGDLCAEVALFAGGTYPATLLAVSDCLLLLLPAAVLLRQLERDPVLARQIIAVLSTRVRHLVGMIEDLSLKEVSARLAKYLLDAAVHAHGVPQRGQSIDLSVAKHELAAVLGTIPETLSRTLRKMAQQRVIRNQRRRITLLDIGRLQGLAAGDKL